MVKQSRLKLGIGIMLLYLIEGIIKHFLTGFPIEIVVGAQGAVTLYYFNRKTDSNNVYNKANGNVQNINQE